MKLSTVLALLALLFVHEAMAQRRPPPPRPRPRPMPVPPRRPVPMPRPRPVPAPPVYSCVGADLYHYNFVIHRFRWINDCHISLQDLRYRGRFCDEGALFDGNGNFMRQYPNQFECRNWLK